MRNVAGSSGGWLRRLWDRGAAAEAPHPGEERLLSSGVALGLTQMLVCDAVVHRPATPRNAIEAARMVMTQHPGVNAFGRPVVEYEAAGVRESVAMAEGMALAGVRTTACLARRELEEARAGLHALAQRPLPMVVHVDAASGLDGGLPVDGCFQLVAASGQEAVDLSLVARWVSERALVPGLVVVAAGGISRLRLPDPALIRAFLGASDDAIPSPTPVQEIFFGATRQRVHAWFDEGHPLATTGAPQGRCAHQQLFWSYVPSLLDQAMKELGDLTGRRLRGVTAFGMDKADMVLLCQGRAAAYARAVAEALHKARGWQVGVLTVAQVHPFPVEALKAALDGRSRVAVLDSGCREGAAGAPLFAAVREAMGTASDAYLSATVTGQDDEPTPGQLTALCELLRRGAQQTKRIHLAGPKRQAEQEEGFPRRDALLQGLRGVNVRPGDGCVPASAEPLVAARGFALGLMGEESELPADLLERAGACVAQLGGPEVQGTLVGPQDGVWRVRVQGAQESFSDPGPMARVDALVLACSELHLLGDPLVTLAKGGTLLVAFSGGPEQLWAAMPRRWQEQVQEKELRIFLVPGGGLPEWLEGVSHVQQGRACELSELAWQGLAEEPCTGERPLPAVVRRITRERRACDSLPRFWGEVAQPLQELGEDGAQDPFAATGVVPGCASALAPGAALGNTLPRLEVDKCTGCGRCWAACPDSAIGVSVLSLETLLTSASEQADTCGKEADALRRAHKHLAGRIASTLAGRGATQVTREDWQGGYDWLIERLGVTSQERAAYDAAFAATVAVLETQCLAVTKALFHEPEGQAKGSGGVLVWAVDPRSCKGCESCAEVCAEAAIEPRTGEHEVLAVLQRRWHGWEALPDTPGEAMEQAATRLDEGRLAALLLSRHCAQAQVGGGGSEPGSGERLASRLVAGMVEHHGQRIATGLLGQLEEKRAALEAKTRAALAGAVGEKGVGVLARALEGGGGGRVSFAELGKRLEELGEAVTIDRPMLLTTLRVAEDVASASAALAVGADGLGRARFGAVVTQGGVGRWATGFPHHPYYAPLTVALCGEGVELARGVAQGVARRHVELVRTVRQAALVLESPPDLREQLQATQTLGWSDLSDDERAWCPPVLLLGNEAAVGEMGVGALGRLLRTDLPLKIIVLTDLARLGEHDEIVRVAMAHRVAFVASASFAFGEHLAQVMTQALRYPRAALVCLHAPSPRRDGFPARKLVERARLAVHARAHVLLRYEPGGKLTLDGDPDVREDWGSANLAEWAAQESRFASYFEAIGEGEAQGEPFAEVVRLSAQQRRNKVASIQVDGRYYRVGSRLVERGAERLAEWRQLQEEAGVTGAWVESVRAQARDAFESELQEKLAAARSEADVKLAEAKESADKEALARLTESLVALCGRGTQPAPGRD